MVERKANISADGGSKGGSQEEVWYHNTCPLWGLGFIARKSDWSLKTASCPLLYDMQKKLETEES